MDYEKAASYWEEKDAGEKKMERGELLAEIESFLTAHNTCALATGCGDFVRCTPIEYAWRGGKFWLFSEGGLKFRGLQKNRNVCLAVFDSYGGFGNLGGMQITGTAELVEPWSPEYLAAAEFKKIPVESLRRLEHPMYLICVAPSRIDFLSSALRRRGFGARQHLEFR
jgi:hypothetical protein